MNSGVVRLDQIRSILLAINKHYLQSLLLRSVSIFNPELVIPLGKPTNESNAEMKAPSSNNRNKKNRMLVVI